MAMFAQPYTFPEETTTHEGTWFQWPHQYQYGVPYRDRLDATWVAMTSALVSSISNYELGDKTFVKELPNGIYTILIMQKGTVQNSKFIKN